MPDEVAVAVLECKTKNPKAPVADFARAAREIWAVFLHAGRMMPRFLDVIGFTV